MDYADESRMFWAWARQVRRDDLVEIARICGLSAHGSTRGTLKTIREKGEKEEFAGYDEPAQEPDLGEYEVVMLFMAWLEAQGESGIVRALTARHLRRADGCRGENPTERQLAVSIYGGPAGKASAALAGDCARGYQYMRDWLISKAAQYEAAVLMRAA